MARRTRGECVDPESVQIIHTTTRCVRQAFLCGRDEATGRDFEHRRDWIRERLEFQASVFAIDCLTFAVMNNHVHQILRTRPDIARGWSDEEVARRWLTLCPPRLTATAGADDPDKAMETEVAKADIQQILRQPELVVEYRKRLSDVSWWMRLLTQRITIRANREDNCKGRFWEGRFGAQLLEDEAAILACSIYVDLNPIRAAMVQSLGDSCYTGLHERLVDLASVGNHSETQQTDADCVNRSEQESPSNAACDSCHGAQHPRLPRSGWLSPVPLEEVVKSTGSVMKQQPARRASDKGFLRMTLSAYLELADWTGRQLRGDKAGYTPSHVPRILESIGVEQSRWLLVTKTFGKIFRGSSAHPITLSTG